MFRKHKITTICQRTVFPKKYGNTVFYLSKKLLRNKNTPLKTESVYAIIQENIPKGEKTWTKNKL